MGGWMRLLYWDSRLMKGAPRQEWMSDEEWHLIELRRSGVKKPDAVAQTGLTTYQFDKQTYELSCRIQEEHRAARAMRADDV